MDFVYTLDELKDTVKQFLDRYGNYRIVAMKGSMGAGKTTFVSALAGYLGVKDPVSSPTYSIINQYRTATDGDFYHLDLYRLSRKEEAIDLGIEELLDSASFCFIEWPELIASLLPSDTLWLEIIPVSEHQRMLKVTEPR